MDGSTHALPRPFVVIATQNPVGSAGTQLLPQAQLDRFMIRLEMGYPDFESQVNILRDRQTANPIDRAEGVISAEEILAMQEDVQQVFTDVCGHRMILNPKARIAELTAEGVLKGILKRTKSPDSGR